MRRVKRMIAAAVTAAVRELQGAARENDIQRDFEEKSRLLVDGGRFRCSWDERLLIVDDATEMTSFDAHYLYHTAWAARVLAQTMPEKHIDISSCLRFVSLVSAFVPIDFYDYRPPHLTLGNLSVAAVNITELPFEDASITSLSCMHVVEHVGLERYGDPFNPQGDLQAMSELQRVLAPGGQLLFVVPVGRVARIVYNAHRIYAYSQIKEAFGELDLMSFAYIDDAGTYYADVPPSVTEASHYGCGCFYFVRSA